MKTVNKFTSFADLKLVEEKITDYKTRRKKHNAFEKIIMEIYCAKVHTKDNSKSE